MPFSPPAEFASVDNILILVVVVLLVFGSTQIPKLARSLGSAQKEFKKGLDEGASEDPQPATAEVAAPAVAPAVAPAPATAPAPAPPVAQAPPAADGTPGAPS
jgi:sec-independent protein translocase protein TatA